jgi:preprotein translocase subunit Sec61beta
MGIVGQQEEEEQDCWDVEPSVLVRACLWVGLFLEKLSTRVFWLAIFHTDEKVGCFGRD